MEQPIMNALLKRLDILLLTGSLSLNIVIASCSSPGVGRETVEPAIDIATPVESSDGNATPDTALSIQTVVETTATVTLALVISSPIPSLTVEPLSTAVPVPTLTKIEQGDVLSQLMMQDEACKLPCWWQIELGSNLDDVGEQFQTLGLSGWSVSPSDLEDGNEKGSIRIGYFDPASSFYYVDVWGRFYTIDNKVSYIQVDALRPIVDYGLAEFQRDWEPYFLSSIIEALGEPTFGYLLPITEAEPGIINETLLLYYPEQGINVAYEYRVSETAQGEKQLCLDPGNIRQLRLSLFLPQHAEQWASYLLPPEQNPAIAESYEGYLWQERTGQEFISSYQAYRESQQTCVNLR